MTRQTLECYQKKLKSAQQTSRGLVKKVESVEDVTKMLKRKDLVLDNCISILEKCLSGAFVAINLTPFSKTQTYSFFTPAVSTGTTCLCSRFDLLLNESL